MPAADLNAPDPACRGWLCASPLGLDLRHFHPLHTAQCFVLIITSFSVHWWIAYTCMAPEPRLLMRCLWAVALTASYAWLIIFAIPWNPYWIRELHVMACIMSAWKLAELALLRRGERLRTPWLRFLAEDAICLRPDCGASPGGQTSRTERGSPAASRDPVLGIITATATAKATREAGPAVGGGAAEGGATWPSVLCGRVASALPVLGLAAVQYLGVEVRRVSLGWCCYELQTSTMSCKPQR